MDANFMPESASRIRAKWSGLALGRWGYFKLKGWSQEVPRSASRIGGNLEPKWLDSVSARRGHSSCKGGTKARRNPQATLESQLSGLSPG